MEPFLTTPLIKGIAADAEYGLAYFFTREDSFQDDYFNGTVDLLLKIAYKYPLILPVHESHYKRLQQVKKLTAYQNIHVLDEISYPEYLALIEKALFVVADTNNIQEECTRFHTPCVTLSPFAIQTRAIADNSGFIDVNDHVKVLYLIAEIKPVDNTIGKLTIEEPFSSGEIGKLVVQYLQKQNSFA